ncbi:MAG TPA: type IV secretion system DNA-binding domain-containing protein [Steroidobacteraceae bacterium]|nr:type IV secretion system DNA-binding domain-containing protein [Steroidobacteraceae bacterium]
MTVDALMRGTPGLLTAYAAVQAPMLVGLARGRAAFRQYLSSPALAAALTAGVGAALSMFQPWLHAAAAAWGALAPFTVGTLASAAAGYAGGRLVAAQEPAAVALRRGTMLEEEGVHRRRPARATASPTVRLAGLEVPATDEAKHFKLIGTTGTGKSTAIRELIGCALRRADRAVIADPDGGYTARFYDAERGDRILNPFDARSMRWDLFAEIDSAYDVDQLARSLIPDRGGADRIWSEYARTFFSAVTVQARDAGVEDVGELFRLFVVADAAELRVLVRGTPAQPFLDEHNAKMFDSVRSVAAAAIGPLQHVAAQRAAPLSIRHWVAADEPGVLFMPYKAGQIAALRSMISAWMRLGIFEAMNRDEARAEPQRATRRPLWFVVDELDALGQIDGLKDALARLRKFDARCVLGFQSIAQVSSIYGAGDAQTIVENCGNTLILRCSASEGGGTARFASQLVGDREVRRTTVSRSRRATEFFGSTTRSEHLNVEPALLPSQIEQLPDLAGYLKHASGATWRRVTLAPEPPAARDRGKIAGDHGRE